MQRRDVLKALGIVSAGAVLWKLAGNMNSPISVENTGHSPVLEPALETKTEAELERMYLAARTDSSIRGEFVRNVKSSIVLPDSVLGIGYNSNRSIEHAFMRVKYFGHYSGTAIEPSKSFIEVFPEAFSGNTINNINDFMSSLRIHEFTHANLLARGGGELVKYAITQDGKLDEDLFYKVVSELESYKAEIIQNIGFVEAGLVPNPKLSRQYTDHMLKQAAIRLEVLKNWNNKEKLKPGAIEYLVSQYDLPQLRFVKK